MAIKATIFKTELQVSDMDRGYYRDHTLTLARHPSETDERMRVRLLAFALHADEALLFGRGLSTDDEPDLWQKDLTGAVELWIDVGLPTEKDIRKACGRARQVVVYCYGGRGVQPWWDQVGGALQRLNNLTVRTLPSDATRALASLAQRNMHMQCTIQEGDIWAAAADETVHVTPTTLKSATAAG